jgi:general secretion pathway protein K
MKPQARGVALLLVIWLLAMTSLMLGGLVTVVRQELQLGFWQREHIRAIWAAEGGIALAVRGLSDPVPARRWLADGRMQVLDLEGTKLQIQVRSELGKLDLNEASGNDLARVVLRLGGTQDQAQTLASIINQRRAAGDKPIRVLEEICAWPGMTVALFGQLAPHLTLWSGLPRPEPAFASPTLRQALDLAYVPVEGRDPGPILSIQSVATGQGGISATIDSTVLLSIEQNSRPFRVLRYSE